MQPKPFFVNLFAFLILTIALQGCKPARPGIYSNDQIKSGQRDDFHSLNTKLLTELKANNPHLLEGLMSNEFIADGTRLRQIELLSNRLNEADYELLDEFYIVNDPKDKSTIKAEDRGINNYNMHYDTLTHEIYIAHFVPKKNAIRYMITAVYGKYDYGWKVNRFDLDEYAVNGKTAPELYKLAKEDYDKKYLVDAANLIQQAQDCIHPCQGWQYQQEAEIKGFADKASDELNRKYNFPYTLKQVSTMPMVFRVLTQKTDDGVFPMVYYLSDIKLTNVAALNKENEQVKKVIGKVMPGIDKDKKYILYSVFNQMPDGSKAFDHYDITDKLQP